MTMHCGKCGAELLGAVNRCWKCGQHVVSRADAVSRPPVRRPPVSGPLGVAPWEALAAEVVDETPAVVVADGAAAESPGKEPPARGTNKPAARRGSPFAAGAVLRRALDDAVGRARDQSPAKPNLSGAPVEVERQEGVLPLLPMIFAFVFGGGSFSISDYPEVALGAATLGLVFAAIAVVRRLSLGSGLALTLCLLAFFRGGYVTGVAVFERTYGHSPWSDPEEFELTPEPTNDDLLKS